jgi:hypothetical protein
MIKAAVPCIFAVFAVAFSIVPPGQAGTFHGVVAQGSLTAADYQRMDGGDVGTLRRVVSWRNIEPTRGDRNWAPLDAVVRSAAEAGVRVLPVVGGPGPAGTSHPPTDPRSRRGYADFVGDMVDRYGRGGTFWEETTVDLPITAWQIRNEQNGPAYWGARPNPRKYATLLKATAKQIRRQDRKAEIVLGGMFSTPRGRGAMTSWSYLQKLYRVRGAKKAFSTVAIHPYAAKLGQLKKQIRRIRTVMKRNHDRRAGLRITEIGWGSGFSGSEFNVGPQGQARMLRKSFGLLERNRGAWKVKGVNWFSWQDGAAGCSFCATSGLFKVNRDPKPAWLTFVQVSH